MRVSVVRTLIVMFAALAPTLGGCGRVPALSVPGLRAVRRPAPPPAPPPDPQAEAALVDHPRIPIATVPPERGSIRMRRHWVYYIRGGRMVTVWSHSREMVSDLIAETGGMAGLNGTFFSDARVAGRGNKMIGPVLTAADGSFAPMDPSDGPRCQGRPLVILGATELAIVPYADWMGTSTDALRRLVPDARDAFLAGGWLVHNGLPATREEVEALCVADAQDPRRRAFMGVDDRGRLVLGASDFSIDSARLAAALPQIGIREAVLLDSGFSTSLVWKDQILVSGHSRRDMPSRPVPHALVIREPDPAVTAAGANAAPAVPGAPS